MASAPETVTNLLLEMRQGHPDAIDRLIPIVYDELRALAAAYLDRDAGGHTLQPTALVHELYFKLVDQRRTDWQSRAHFFGTAALLMRRLIVDHARRRGAAKRGGGRVVSLTTEADVAETGGTDVLRVHDALETLATFDPRQAKVVELRFFGGLTNEEAAQVLGVSLATVKRDWTLARAWLHAELAHD